MTFDHIYNFFLFTLKTINS